MHTLVTVGHARACHGQGCSVRSSQTVHSWAQGGTLHGIVDNLLLGKFAYFEL